MYQRSGLVDANEHRAKQQQNKSKRMATLNKEILAWCRVRALAAALYLRPAAGCQTTPSGLSIEARLDVRLGESQQWLVHLNINKRIKSAPWYIKHVVTSFRAATGTTYPPNTLSQYTSPHHPRRVTHSMQPMPFSAAAAKQRGC